MTLHTISSLEPQIHFLHGSTVVIIVSELLEWLGHLFLSCTLMFDHHMEDNDPW